MKYEVSTKTNELLIDSKEIRFEREQLAINQ